MATPPEWRPSNEAAASLLADIEAVTAEVAKKIRNAVPEYVYVSDEDLQQTAGRNMQHILKTAAALHLHGTPWPTGSAGSPS